MKASRSLTFFVDLMTVLLSYGPGLGALLLSIHFLRTFDLWWLQVLLFPFLLQFCFVVIIFGLRILLPRLEAGVYPVGFNRGFFAWYSHSMLTRSARCFGIHYLLHCTASFRFLYWRALGAKVPFNMSTSCKITIHDAPMIELSEGVTLAEDVTLSGHLVRGDKVLVAPVKIGKGVFVGRETYVGPRTRIGDQAWVGMDNILSGDVVEPGQKVASHEWAQGKPRKD